MIRNKPALAGFVLGAVLLAPCWQLNATAADDTVFAVVDGVAISTDEFQGALRLAVRQKYYHRQPREEQLAELRQEIADHLVNRLLLLKEGRRRGIQPDAAKVHAEVGAFEKRNRDRSQWREHRAEMLPALNRAVEEQSIIAQLEAAVRLAPSPTDANLRAYYESHPEQFTEPERVRLAVILLKVDPAAPGAAVEQALARAQELVERLAAGTDFAKLARLHSGDSSARDGGDMGYRHLGTLPTGVEAAVGRLAPGATTEPLRLLEGIAVFRLLDRRAPQLRSLEDVRRNVADLWAREQGEAQWRALIARLRAGADVQINGELLRGGAAGGATADVQVVR